MLHEDDYIGKPVRSLQTMLRVIAADQQNIPMQIPDGIFGQNTEQSVKAFQQEHGLPADGVVDLTTWDAISEQFEKSSINLSREPTLQPAFTPRQTIFPGEQNHHISLLQAIMHVLSQKYNNLPDTALTGVYDRQTQDAVQKIKALFGHESDDAELHRDFVDDLFALYRCAAGDGLEE